MGHGTWDIRTWGMGIGHGHGTSSLRALNVQNGIESFREFRTGRVSFQSAFGIRAAASRLQCNLAAVR
jgi:hypothetical protein